MRWRLALALLAWGPALGAGRAEQVSDAGLAILDVPDAGRAYVSGPVTACCRGADGLLFVGSTNLAAYDGTAWRRFDIPGASRFLGLAADDGGNRIWIAANGAIGYLRRKNGEDWRFTSLGRDIPAVELGEIRFVLPDGAGAVFVSRANVFRWDGRRFTSWSLPSPVRLYPFSDGSRLLIYRKGSGLLRMDPTGPSLWLSQNSLPSPAPMVALLPLAGGGYFAVFSDGAFLYRGGQWQRLVQASAALQGKQAICALRLDEETIAIGTFYGGAMLVKVDGSVVRLVNSQTGLADDSVNSLWAENGQLWIGMATSLARLPSAHSASLYNQRIGLGSGVIRRVLLQDGRPAILGTHRIYRLSGSSSLQPAQLVRLDPYWSQLSDGLALEGRLWVCGVGGLWEVNGDRTAQPPATGDIYCLLAPPDPARGLVIFGPAECRLCTRGDAGWTLSPALARYSGIPTSAVQEPDGKIWLATDRGWIYAYAWSPSRDRLVEQGRYRANPGSSPTPGPPQVALFAGRVFVFGAGNILAFDPARSAFVLAPEFAEFDGLAAPLSGEGPHVYWLVRSKKYGKSGPIALIRVDSAGAASALRWTGLLAPGLEQGVETFTLSITRQGGDETIWIGGTNTLLRLESAGLGAARAVGGLVPEGVRKDESGQMVVSFVQAAPADADAGISYQTKLEPVERDWLPPESSARRRFTALAAGHYRLLARAVDRFGQPGPVAVSAFIVPDPWYAAPPALALWLLGAVGLVLAGYRLRLRQLERQTERLNRLINERTRELSLSNTAKSEFLENISHEIRNPLNGIVGLVNLLDESGLSSRQREQARALRSCSQTLSRAVDDILDFSKLEYGTIRLNEREFSLPLLLESVRAIFAASAGQRDTPLSIRCPPGPEWFLGDDEKIKTILCNFVGNALKYAPGAPVEIAVSAVGAEVLLEVTDEGAGIPAEEQELIFKKFVRGSRAKESSIPGSGIGLATCRLTAKLLAGSVGVESPPAGRPRGTTFFLKLPLRRVSIADRVEDALARGAGTALVVEDQDYNRLVMAGLLDRIGLHACMAQTGEEALALASSSPLIRLIFADLELAGIKGPELARRLRTLPGGDRFVIIGTSAHDGPDAPLRCREAGMNDFLLKPLSLQSVQAAIERAMAAPSRPALDRSALELYGRQVAGGLDEALARYAAEMKVELEALARSVRAGDAAAMASAAHRVRSHAGLVGAASLGEAAGELEREARAGAVKDPWQRLHAVQSAADSVRAELGTAVSVGESAS